MYRSPSGENKSVGFLVKAQVSTVFMFSWSSESGEFSFSTLVCRSLLKSFESKEKYCERIFSRNYEFPLECTNMSPFLMSRNFM